MNPIRRRSFLGVATACALLPPIYPAMADVNPTQLVVAPLAGPDCASLYYAIQQGWFQQAGLDVVAQAVPNGGAGMSALLGGSVQVAYGNVLTLSEAHQKGAQITLIAPGAAYSSTTPSAKLVVGADSPLRTLKDLEGKVVAVPSLVDLLAISVQSLLDQAGADRKTVHFTEMPPSAMPAALDAKRVDAIAVYDPFLSAAEAKGARSVGKPYDAISLHFEVAAWFTTIAFANAHREAILKFASVLNRAAQYYDTHYAELIPMIADFSKIPADVLRKLTPPQVPASLTPASIQPVIDAAAKYDAISSTFPAKDLIYR